MSKRPVYDCDTLPYWCSDSDYLGSQTEFGHFTTDGTGYTITQPQTPRPWLNYLCNDHVAMAVSNLGKGFLWYKSSLLRITKYDHPIDYLPRDFQDGRVIILEDTDSGKQWRLFDDYDDIQCTHCPSHSLWDIQIAGLHVQMTIFVPVNDAGECWILSVDNPSGTRRAIRIIAQQTWSIARFGIHTAEEGIPYLTTPGEYTALQHTSQGVLIHSSHPGLPVQIHAGFISPQCGNVHVETQIEKRPDGRIFRFPVVTLEHSIQLSPSESVNFHVLSAAHEEDTMLSQLVEKYTYSDVYLNELKRVQDERQTIHQNLQCQLPDADMQRFMNVWFKHQLYLTFRYVRSGYVGYRDSLQDTWGYHLLEPHRTRDRLLTILSHMKTDGSCPRNFSPFGMDDQHDLRNFMDSATWIGLALTDYIKETGDWSILKAHIPYLDDASGSSVETHVWRAMDLLYEKRGLHGLCLIGDGDWNDGIEGISKQGPAVSVWLTIALYHCQNLLSQMYTAHGDPQKAMILKKRSDVLYQCINESAWDGNWYVYAFSGKGNPIGSHQNKEGFIHLNSNTWAVFTGIAQGERAAQVMTSIHQHLDTPLGPALLYPPYVEEGDEVGRIARLEPGTFENGSVYKHAVSFKIFADVATGDYNQAYQTMVNLLPTNPANPDTRRTSEPYTLGNYYCGPSHERFGQNFFSWFTGSPAWLLRAGYDQILGVRADYDALVIDPKVPDNWDNYRVSRHFRGTVYDIIFQRVLDKSDTGIWVDDERSDSHRIYQPEKDECSVMVKF